jgi:hypothetical protein
LEKWRKKTRESVVVRRFHFLMLFSNCKFKIFVQEVHGRSAVNVVFSVRVRIERVCRDETLVGRCHRNCTFL